MSAVPAMVGEHHRGPQFSPLLIGLTGIVAGAIIVAISVATYHCIAVGCCHHQRPDPDAPHRLRTRGPGNNRDRTSSTSNSSSSAMLVPFPVYSYSKECDEAMCSVCLGDFIEGEPIRVLPECLHFFHVECINKWLSSRSNCPLCRASAMPPQHLVLSLPDWGRAQSQESHSHLVPFYV